MIRLIILGLFFSFSALAEGVEAPKQNVVIVVGTHHYSPQKSMPLFAKESPGTLYLTDLQEGAKPLLHKDRERFSFPCFLFLIPKKIFWCVGLKRLNKITLY